MTTLQIQDLLTPEQAGQRIGMSRKWVIARIREAQKGDPNGLPAVNVSKGPDRDGKGARFMVNPDVLDGWLRSWLNAA